MSTANTELQEEGYKLMGAAFEVYNEQGFGMAEEIYQESLEIELELRQIPAQSKQELKTFYKNRPLKKRYIPDLVVSLAASLLNSRLSPSCYLNTRRN